LRKGERVKNLIDKRKRLLYIICIVQKSAGQNQMDFAKKGECYLTESTYPALLSKKPGGNPQL